MPVPFKLLALTALAWLAWPVALSAQLPALLTYPQADSAAAVALSQMSLKQKVYEMHGHGVVRMGLSVLFTGSVKPVRAGGSKKLNIPSTVFLDGPRGVSLTKGATAFPVTMARGASWDPELESRIGEAMATEIKALGGNYSGAVCMNLLRHPAWGRAQETYGEDPYHIGTMASALVKGIQQHRVQGCIKHFAANSMENNRFGGSMNMDERTLREVYLPHFKMAVDAGAASVMSAYNKLNGEYCGHHRFLLADILRNEWGFKGYVTSDWMWGLFDAEKGIEAGMNIEMPSGKVYNQRNIKKLLKEQRITLQDIDSLIRPTIATKLLFADNEAERRNKKEVLANPAHTALALKAAEESAVLLKNSNGLLPLKKEAIKKIAVLGSLAAVEQTGDKGSSGVRPPYIVSAVEGLRHYLSNDSVQLLYAPLTDTQQVTRLAAEADVVVIVAGTTYLDEGEYIGDGQIRNPDNKDKKNLLVSSGILGLGGDRAYLHLHQPDIELIQRVTQVNKNVVVTLVAGSAVTVEEWEGRVPAILHTFYNGMEGGHALARLLFGRVNPCGKLPFTVPFTESQLPPFNSYAPQADYGYYHGYTLFDKTDNSPRYPFGYGLSYTQFAVGAPLLSDTIVTGADTVWVTTTVKNTGNVAGAEVVQLYAGFPASTVNLPVKLLRGFKKVWLQPGEEKAITLPLPVSSLAWYNTDAKEWQVEKTYYSVYVGNSSRWADLLKDSFEVTGP